MSDQLLPPSSEPASSMPPPAPQPPQPAAPVLQVSSVGRLIGAYLLDTVLSLVTLGVGWVIWAAITAGEGATPGKRLLGMKVVNKETGATLSWAQYVFLRGLVGGLVLGIPVSLVLGIPLLFMPLWDKLNQSVPGKVSNSVVIDVR